MKKLLFFLLLVFLFSCKKDKEYCFICNTVITTTGGPYASNVTSSTVTSCGITEDDAEEIERKMTSTATGGGITVRSVTICTKQ